MLDAWTAVFLMFPQGASAVSVAGHFGVFPVLEAADSPNLACLQPVSGCAALERARIA